MRLGDHLSQILADREDNDGENQPAVGQDELARALAPMQADVRACHTELRELGPATQAALDGLARLEQSHKELSERLEGQIADLGASVERLRQLVADELTQQAASRDNMCTAFAQLADTNALLSEQFRGDARN